MNIYKQRCLVIVIALFLVAFQPAPTLARTSDTKYDKLFSLSLEELLKIEVSTATVTFVPLREVPAAMYVITEQHIKTRGYQTLVDALHDVPGFDFRFRRIQRSDLIAW